MLLGWWGRRVRTRLIRWKQNRHQPWISNLISDWRPNYRFLRLINLSIKGWFLRSQFGEKLPETVRSLHEQSLGIVSFGVLVLAVQESGTQGLIERDIIHQVARFQPMQHQAGHIQNLIWALWVLFNYVLFSSFRKVFNVIRDCCWTGGTLRDDTRIDGFEVEILIKQVGCART